MVVMSIDLLHIKMPVTQTAPYCTLSYRRGTRRYLAFLAGLPISPQSNLILLFQPVHNLSRFNHFHIAPETQQQGIQLFIRNQLQPDFQAAEENVFVFLALCDGFKIIGIKINLLKHPSIICQTPTSRTPLFP